MLVAIVIAVNITCFFPGILEGDSMLYATIAKRIAQSNDWLNLYVDGRDWLDKPHFPFWAAALSFKLFGYSSFAYKLPGFVFWCLSLFYIYRTGKLLYGDDVAKAAVLIFGSSLHAILSNFDIRAESYLTTFIIAALYYILRAHEEGRLKYFIGIAIATAGAILTKGIFAGIIIGSGYFIFLLASRQMKILLHWKWLTCLLLTALLIMPELYALYVQFDLHPEKIVYGHTNVSGIRFFLWDSQFGRFFNTGPIKGKGDFSFFIHTTLWAFLPWSFLFIAGLWQIIKRRKLNSLTVVLTGSALISFLMFSVSKFQLPHYIVILFPHFSLITAVYLVSLKDKKVLHKWSIYLSVLIIIACTGMTMLACYSSMGDNLLMLLPLWIFGGAAIFIFKRADAEKLAVKGITFSVILFWFLNISFYPGLMKYQAGSMAAGVMNKMNLSSPVVMYGENNQPFEFWSQSAPAYWTASSDQQIEAMKKPVTAFIPEEYFPQLTAAGCKYSIIQCFDAYRITKLKGAFLNAKTRSKTTGKKFLITIYQ
jgi:4-amino-4-deoxy-L-arabinose transferase-like glycosyltransferase